MQKLLALLAAGKPQTIGSLAGTLNVTEGIIQLMTAQLVQLGYLQDAGACDSQPGSGHTACHGCAGCMLSSPQHSWALTEKGLQAARASHSS